MTPLLGRRFRGNPAYELDVSGPPSDKRMYGYLRPRGGAPLECRAITADAALLFLSLGCGGQVPEHFRRVLGALAEGFLRRLVLDEVLEVEHEGRFIGGTAAATCLASRGPPRVGRIASLSRDALRYAAAMRDHEIPDLTRRIYDFGRLPLSTARICALREAGIEGFGTWFAVAKPALGAQWIPTPSADTHWIMWRPLRHGDSSERVRYKLYVSPTVDHVPRALAAAAEVLGPCVGVRGLKMGRGTAGVSRPDKLVAYFSRLDELQHAGAQLARRLAGCPVHGVPLTAELSRDGLIGWGADPPRDSPYPGGSWRYWLAGRLANHLASVRCGTTPEDAVRFAIERMRCEGVNPDTWTPEAGFWDSRALAI